MVREEGNVKIIDEWVLPDRAVEVVSHPGDWAMVRVGYTSLIPDRTAGCLGVLTYGGGDVVDHEHGPVGVGADCYWGAACLSDGGDDGRGVG